MLHTTVKLQPLVKAFNSKEDGLKKNMTDL